MSATTSSVIVIAYDSFVSAPGGGAWSTSDVAGLRRGKHLLSKGWRKHVRRVKAAQRKRRERGL